MNTEQLRNKVLDLAIHGKLVPQDPNDEPALVLLDKIRKEKERLVREGKLKKDKQESIIFQDEDGKYYERIEKVVRCIDDEIPFEIPKGWKWVKLNNYVKLVTDFVASGSFASLRENVKYFDTENYAILVRTLDLQNNFSKKMVYTDKHGYEFLHNSNLFGGELVLPNIGASIGKVFIVPYLKRKMTLAPNSIMLRFYSD